MPTDNLFNDDPESLIMMYFDDIESVDYYVMSDASNSFDALMLARNPGCNHVVEVHGKSGGLSDFKYVCHKSFQQAVDLAILHWREKQS